MKMVRKRLAANRRLYRLKSVLTAFLVMLLTLAQVQVAGAEIVNSVIATGSFNGVAVASPPASETVDVVDAAPVLSISKTATISSFVNAGDTVAYDIEVSNNGNVTLTNVTISDPDADTLSCPGGGSTIAILAPGETVLCSATIVADSADVTNGSITNNASASATDPDGNSVGPVQSSATVNRTGTDLVTVKTLASSDPTPSESDIVTFRIAVTNNGPDQATGVEVTDSLPAGLSYFADDGGGAFDPGTGVWTIGVLDNGDTAILEISVTVDNGTAGQTLTNTAFVTRLDQTDANAANDDNSESVTIAAADLLTIKSVVTPGPFSEGDSVEFEIAVTNFGPQPATNVTLTDILPPGLTASGAVATPSQGSFDAGSGVWTIGPIAVDATATIILEAIIDAGQAGQTIINSTSAASSPDVSDPVTGNDSLEAQIDVGMPVIDAVDDSANNVNGVSGASNVVNVLDNDTIDGNEPAAGDVTLVNLTPGGPLTLNADGAVDVAPTTPAGTYDIDYEICVAAYPSICDTATVSVSVIAPPIDAVDDSKSAIADGVNGSVDFINVLTNDTIGGIGVSPADVALTELSQGPGVYLQLDPDGTIDVLPGTPAGTYTLNYQICDVVNPASCDTAVATIVADAPASISGVVYQDDNGNGFYDAGTDTPQGNYDVELIQGGVVIATTLTALDGTYSISPVPAGTDYRLVFKSPSGTIVGGISNINLVPGQNLIDQNLPIDPSGVVYDAVTRSAVSGAAVSMTNSAGIPLPAACFVDPASQGQITGADGSYRFDIIPGADPACPPSETLYRLVVSAPAGFASSISTLLPPWSGNADITICTFDAVAGGSCQASASPNPPAIGAPAIYLLEVRLEAGDPHLTNNHLPVDPFAAPANISLTKTADFRTLRRGERVNFLIEAVNSSGTTYTDVSVIDVIPSGFRYAAGSATVNGAPANPLEAGSQLIFPNLTLGANQTLTIGLSLDALSSAGPGRYVNRARLLDQAANPLAPEATATVEIEQEAVFDCSDVIGRVFEDTNRNGYEESGEPGLPAIRLATVTGLLVTTDRHGRFHIACADIPQGATGSNFILKLDERTLPAGYRLTTENPRVIRLTPGKTAKIGFGAATGRVVKLDINGGAFEDNSIQLKPRWIAGIDQLIEILRREFSVLRLTYRAEAGEGELSKKRVNAIIALIRTTWDSHSESYPLEIDSKIVE